MYEKQREFSYEVAGVHEISKINQQKDKGQICATQHLK